MMRKQARIGVRLLRPVCASSQATSSVLNLARIQCLATSSGPKPPREGVDWGSMSFALTKTDYMYVATAKKGQSFTKGEIKPYGPLALEPAATVLSYGQALFEGLKAFRTFKERVVVFRPRENWERMSWGAKRFLMSPVPEDVFMDAVNQVVKANSHWVPPAGQGALYLRPILFGSGSNLGVAPSTEYTLVIYVSPVGSYFKGGLKTINLLSTSEIHRAAPKGAGAVKAAGNYAPCFLAQVDAKSKGFDEVLFLDAKEEKYIEEAGAANLFCVTKDLNNNNKNNNQNNKNNEKQKKSDQEEKESKNSNEFSLFFKQGTSGLTLHTPALRGTILAGVTRRSVVQLAIDKGHSVNEGLVPLERLLEAEEAFCTGTGASITPVGSVTTDQGKRYPIGNGGVGPVTKDLYDTLLGIQTEKIEDKHRWLHDPWQY
jgi:branched-chain amino acid aminotransferase